MAVPPTLSPAEVMLDIVLSRTDRDVVPHVVVGKASHEQQQAGVVTLVDAGRGREELYAPLVRPRIQIRCLAPTMAESDALAGYVFERLHGLGRTVATQESTGLQYLVHFINITGGPSQHFDTEETDEGLMFADTMMGTQPVGPA